MYGSRSLLLAFVVALIQADDPTPGLCGEADNALSAHEKKDGSYCSTARA
jgi:hypothetical protein